ncbi:hypothetical protein BHE74_00035066 [Ensete ventricosum]|nr:hypothetical protein BHE74_00035066 [Ensete ventricosum]RZS26267.1 hypothetical protein BHM03_00059589 [Ensete ventricosum]
MRPGNKGLGSDDYGRGRKQGRGLQQATAARLRGSERCSSGRERGLQEIGSGEVALSWADEYKGQWSTEVSLLVGADATVVGVRKSTTVSPTGEKKADKKEGLSRTNSDRHYRQQIRRKAVKIHRRETVV